MNEGDIGLDWSCEKHVGYKWEKKDRNLRWPQASVCFSVALQMCVSFLFKEIKNPWHHAVKGGLSFKKEIISDNSETESRWQTYSLGK